MRVEISCESGVVSIEKDNDGYMVTLSMGNRLGAGISLLLPAAPAQMVCIPMPQAGPSAYK